MKKKKSKLNDKISKIWQGDQFDPNGSYVGTDEAGRWPVQDADDL